MPVGVFSSAVASSSSNTSHVLGVSLPAASVLITVTGRLSITTVNSVQTGMAKSPNAITLFWATPEEAGIVGLAPLLRTAVLFVTSTCSTENGVLATLASSESLYLPASGMPVTASPASILPPSSASSALQLWKTVALWRVAVSPIASFSPLAIVPSVSPLFAV